MNQTTQNKKQKRKAVRWDRYAEFLSLIVDGVTESTWRNEKNIHRERSPPVICKFLKSHLVWALSTSMSLVITTPLVKSRRLVPRYLLAKDRLTRLIGS